MVRSVLAVLSSIDVKTLEEGAASLGAGPWRRLVSVILPQCPAGHFGRIADGGNLIGWRIQHDLDAAYSLDQDLAGRPRRRLCLDAPGSRQRLYRGVPADDPPLLFLLQRAAPRAASRPVGAKK